MSKEVLIVLVVFLSILIVFLIAPTVFIRFYVFSRYKSKDCSFFEENRKEIKNNIEIQKKGTALKSKISKTVEIKSRDNLILKAEYIDNHKNKTAILFHGYHSTPGNCFFELANIFIELGYNVLLPYQRAHNKSKGNLCSFGIKEQYDVLDWIDSIDSSIEEIVVGGGSMGCTSVAFSSNKIKDNRVKALILECGFINPFEFIKYCSKKIKVLFYVISFSNFLFKIFHKVDLNISTTTSLKENKIPTLFIHDELDDVVHISETLKNYEVNASIKKLLVTKQSGHVMSFYKDEKLKDELVDFLNNIQIKEN